MLKRGQVMGDKTIVVEMEAFKLHILKAPGLHPIKQVELYKKIALLRLTSIGKTLVPDSDEVLAQVKDESSKKRKKKVTAAKPAPKKRVQRAPKVKNVIGLGGGGQGRQERQTHKK
jgi:hypothetical protein